MAVPSSGTLTMGNLNGENVTGTYGSLVTSEIDLGSLTTSAAGLWDDGPDGVQPYGMNEFYGTARTCFVKGTKVLMGDGSEKNIEDVVVGDLVQTKDGNQKVNKLLRHPPTTPLYSINDSKGFVTNNHPFYTKDGWKVISVGSTDPKQKDYILKEPLSIGDFIRTNNGWVEVHNIKKEREGLIAEQFYNLSIDKTHSYFADGYLVHNKCFVGNTLINMANGTQKRIDEIVVGDMVDTISGSQEVRSIESPVHNNLMQYHFDLGTTECTDDHPFWDFDKQSWVSNNPSASMSSYNIHCEQITTGSRFTLTGLGPNSAIKHRALQQFPFDTLIQMNDITGSFQTYTFSTDSQTYYANKKLVHSEI